jgi:hypothetical protein
MHMSIYALKCVHRSRKNVHFQLLGVAAGAGGAVPASIWWIIILFASHEAVPLEPTLQDI